MRSILKLRNRIQDYAWGSRTAIAELLGQPSPAPGPQAELWMGDHPQAPSEAYDQGRWIPLGELIGERPEEILGARVTTSGDRLPARSGLPFLFKVLAAAEPLSIQAHPNAEQARAGFDREDRLGIGRDAAERNYRDPHPKPEILYALTPFAAVCGFRPPREIHWRLQRLGVDQRLPETMPPLESEHDDALDRFFRTWMTLEPSRVAELLEPALQRAGELATDSLACRWVVRLAERYPGDRGVLAPVFLNCFELEPGQALHTGPGVLHAYLDGVGIELMSCSDNVLRGGLTPKHVDVAELLQVLRFEPQAPGLLTPEAPGAGIERFATADGLALEVLDVRPDRPLRRPGGQVSILLCGAGEGELRADDSLAFRRGDSFLTIAAATEIEITGSATLFRAEMNAR